MTRLNQQFKSEQVHFVKAGQGLIKAVIDNDFGHCEVYLQGAQVTSFVPKGEDEVLWLSEKAVFCEGKAIRGGIPLCWPWFGPHLTDNSNATHGFARISQWQVADVQTTKGAATVLTLSLSQSESSLALWPFNFELQYQITVADTLSVALTLTNTNDCDVQISEALHSYFLVGEIGQVAVEGLSDIDYLDKVDNGVRYKQMGDITVDREVDRVFVDTKQSCLLKDAEKRRTIEVSKSGSNSTILWNPWVDKARAMFDMNDDAYQSFICIESGNAIDNLVTVKVGEMHCISQTIKAVSSY
jgi:glucose-6-phosphate 1-epimerase